MAGGVLVLSQGRDSRTGQGYGDAMVIEVLEFDIDPSERDEWLKCEENNWSRFLEEQPGFVRKQMWQSADNPSKVHAVIWWESMAHWKAIPSDQLDDVARAMGSLERTPTLSVYDVISEC